MADDRVVVVTGAATGVGLACARRFSRDGARLVIADINEDAGEEVAAELGGGSDTALFVRCDVADRLDVRNLMAETLSAFGRVDVLVNSAEIVASGDIFELSEDNLDRVVGTNLNGAFLVGQAVARRIREQIVADDERLDDARRRYAIINISSVSGVFAMPEHLALAVSVAGVNQLTRSMALALARIGVRVNAVAPGVLNTNGYDALTDDPEKLKALSARPPLGRAVDADEVAGMAAFLASGDAGSVTGQIIAVDGGQLALGPSV